jgi:2-hydroxychromene-2-carboxylate isomerase
MKRVAYVCDTRDVRALPGSRQQGREGMMKLTFWFEFASTYSYPSTVRIGELAAKAGVEIGWKPFLLGPIFKARGWYNSPFSPHPAKEKYMVRAGKPF